MSLRTKMFLTSNTSKAINFFAYVPVVEWPSCRKISSALLSQGAVCGVLAQPCTAAQDFSFYFGIVPRCQSGVGHGQGLERKDAYSRTPLPKWIVALATGSG